MDFVQMRRGICPLVQVVRIARGFPLRTIVASNPRVSAAFDTHRPRATQGDTPMGLDLDYFEKRVRSLEQALHRLQHDLEDAHDIAGRIVEEYQQWVKNETPGRELILRRLEELIVRGSPRSVFAKTLVLEFGISRTKSYQMVKDYLVERDAANATQRAALASDAFGASTMR